MISYNFGIQEYSPFNERMQEVFQRLPGDEDGYLCASTKPGWGIEVDEKAGGEISLTAAERGERQRLNGGWGEVRRRDGTIIKQ